jgi:hypothetical protein
MPFCFNTLCQIRTLLNLHSFIFGLMPCGWFICMYLSLFLWEYHYLFMPFWFTPTFSGKQQGRKTRTWCLCVWCSPPSVAELNMCVSVCLLPLYTFMSWCLNGIQDSIVCIITGLWSGWSSVPIPVGVRDFSLLWNVQASYMALPAPSAGGTRALSSGVKVAWS